MSDTQDHEKTTFVRVPGARPETPDTQAEPVAPLDQTVIMKASPRAREAAAALSAEREAKRSQTVPPLPPEHGPSLDNVDFDVTAGFTDDAPAEANEFIDLTQGAAGATPARTPLPATAEPATAGGIGKLVLIAVLVAAVIAAGLWFVTH